MKKIHIGRYTIPALLLAAIIVGSVAATAYVVLQWTTTVTVEANPKVCFVDWSDGTTKANTLSYSVNIFLAILTVDENITHGVWNWDNQAHNVYFKLASENTNSTDVAWIYYKVWDGITTKHSKNETNLDSPDTSWSSVVSLEANTKWTIWIEIKAGDSAGVGHTPQFTFEMKVENP